MSDPIRNTDITAAISRMKARAKSGDVMGTHEEADELRGLVEVLIREVQWRAIDANEAAAYEARKNERHPLDAMKWCE